MPEAAAVVCGPHELWVPMPELDSINVGNP